MPPWVSFLGGPTGQSHLVYSSQGNAKMHVMVGVQAKLTTARLTVVAADVIVHVVLCKNKEAAVRRPSSVG